MEYSLKKINEESHKAINNKMGILLWKIYYI